MYKAIWKMYGDWHEVTAPTLDKLQTLIYGRAYAPEPHRVTIYGPDGKQL